MARVRSVLALLIVLVLVLSIVDARVRRKTQPKTIQQQSSDDKAADKGDGAAEESTKPEETRTEKKPTSSNDDKPSASKTEDAEDAEDADASGESTKTDGESQTSSLPSRLVRRRTYRNSSENPRLTNVMAGLGLASLLLVLLA